VVGDDKVVGAPPPGDAVRPESRPAADELHRLGKRVVMVTDQPLRR
jgi:cation transport ATPase